MYLDRAEDGVRLARQADDDGPLLDRLGGIFDLEDAALRRAGWGLAGVTKGRSGPQRRIQEGAGVQGDRVVVVVVSEHGEGRTTVSLDGQSEVRGAGMRAVRISGTVPFVGVLMDGRGQFVAWTVFSASWLRKKGNVEMETGGFGWCWL